jgi:HPt (histidine-containing phosphotransfer) domain-containing protein
MEAHTRKEAKVQFSGWDNLKADAEGNYSLRMFPLRGAIGRMISYDNASTRTLLVAKEFDVKPGETLKVDIGGGGYIVKGQIMLAEDAPKPVDWKYARVEASTPRSTEYLALPELSEAAKKLQDELREGVMPLFQEVGSLTEEKIEAIQKRWEESPEYKAIIERNKEANEELKRHGELYGGFTKEYVDNFNRSNERKAMCIVDAQGRFQLDDLPPGEWRLEIILNFPSVPQQQGQWGENFADVWRKEVVIKVPDFPADSKREVLELGQPIHLGYDKNERRGPTQW